MESLPNPPVPQKIGAESKGSAANSNRLFDLRSSLSSVKVGARNGAEVKLRLGKKMGSEARLCPKIEYGDGGYVLEDVPHLTDYLPDLPVYFESDEVHACIVTCGGLCPGLNTVIREIVCGLSDMYGVTKILGIEEIQRRGLKVAIAGGLLEFIEKRLKENGHMVIVVAEGAGQDLILKSMQSMDHEDASGNKLLLDVGLWLSQKIKVDFLDYIDAGFCLHDHKLVVKILTGTFCVLQDHFSSNKKKMSINLKYIDPTYMIRAVPSNASDNVYCTLLAHSAIHGAMAGYCIRIELQDLYKYQQACG
ncbi:hypothetical protein BHM03_00040802 [Ensete ventricosum]|nr:hypothetical protein BHM03_00040802 [Ensete ventricosum]